jgi:transmembrane sensor
MVRADNDDREKAREEALAWFVRCHSGDATAADRAAHARWLSASDHNRIEYARLAGVWSDLDSVADPRRSTAHRPARSAVTTRRAFLAGGAALAAASVVVFANPPDFLTADHATGTGELRNVSLSDGSTVELDADSALALDFSARARNVRLLRGRAFFDVAADASRPFGVLAGNGSVTALGTRFVVHEWAGTVTVAVEESAVSVRAPDRSEAVVAAGQNVSFDERRLGAVEPADLASETAWRRGKLIFEDRPLAQVLADVGRYRPGIIRVTDRDLLDLRVSGIFDVSNPEGVLDVIRRTLPVRTVELTRYLVLLRPA